MCGERVFVEGMCVRGNKSNQHQPALCWPLTQRRWQTAFYAQTHLPLLETTDHCPTIALPYSRHFPQHCNTTQHTTPNHTQMSRLLTTSCSSSSVGSQTPSTLETTLRS